MTLKKAAPMSIVFGNCKSRCNLWLSGIVTACSNTIKKRIKVFCKNFKFLSEEDRKMVTAIMHLFKNKRNQRGK